MANHSRNSRTALGELAARLGRLPMALVAGEDSRVRQVIARAVTQVRANRDFDAKTRWHAWHDPTANSGAE